MSYAFPEPGQGWDPAPSRRSAQPPPPPARASVSFWKLYFAVFLGTVSAALFLAAVCLALFAFVLRDAVDDAFDSAKSGTTSAADCATRYYALDPATLNGTDYETWAAANCS